MSCTTQPEASLLSNNWKYLYIQYIYFFNWGFCDNRHKQTTATHSKKSHTYTRQQKQMKKRKKKQEGIFKCKGKLFSAEGRHRSEALWTKSDGVLTLLYYAWSTALCTSICTMLHTGLQVVPRFHIKSHIQSQGDNSTAYQRRHEKQKLVDTKAITWW